MCCMKPLGGSSASAVVCLRVKGQLWKESGLMDMSHCLGRLMKAGSLAIWALGMLARQAGEARRGSKQAFQEVLESLSTTQAVAFDG